MRNPSLKMIVVVLGLPLLVAIADWAWTQGPVYRYRNSGVSAYYEIEDTFGESMGTGVVMGYRRAHVDISEGAEGMATGGISGGYFWLSFEVYVSTPSGSGSAYGNGPIPEQYVSTKPGNRSLSLKVDTNLLSYPFYKDQYGDVPVQFPNIDLYWARTEDDWYRWEGHQVREMGNFIQHSQGSGVRYYTIPLGTITWPDVDLPVMWTYRYGWLGSEKALNMSIWRGPMP